jgi:hypothetical protein
MGEKGLGVGVELEGLREILEGSFFEGRVKANNIDVRGERDWFEFGCLFGLLLRGHGRFKLLEKGKNRNFLY